MRRFFHMKLAAVALGLGLAAAPAVAELRDLEGSVTYRQRIALPPEAQVVVQLVDVSIADAKSLVLGAVTIKPEGQVPVDFRLTYDDAMVVERGRYAVQATIQHQGQVLFRTTQNFAALNNDAPEKVDVMLEQMPSPQVLDLTGQSWQVVMIEGRWIRDAALPNMVFDADGRVAGSGGCNQFQGAYEATVTGLDFGPLISTRMACVDPVGQRELDFLAALERVATASMQNGLLVFLDFQGRAVLSLIPE